MASNVEGKHAQPNEGAVAPTTKRRRMPRAIIACERCRLKKYKCSEAQPCSHCERSGTECKYERSYRRPKDESESSVLQASSSTQVESSARFNTTPVNVVDTLPPVSSSPSDQSEITDVNQHTNGIEFHGSTSSMSFLDSLQRLRQKRMAQGSFSLVSILHNPSFVLRQKFTSDLTVSLAANNFYSKRAHAFIEGYFQGIHFVHPVIDKEYFLLRADRLWHGYLCNDVPFIALYLSILSLGALTRAWNEEELDGLNRFQWSRKLFTEAQALLDETQFTSGLETVQCFYVMAKICQNELNPNLAYMYLGSAIRSSLSAGFNRETPNPMACDSNTSSKIWWGLYSLEIEMSFLLGRPDTLGQDEYHNRAMLPIDNTEFAIIPAMVVFGRIMRKVSIVIYHSRLPAAELIEPACEIEREMDDWLANLPQRTGSTKLLNRKSGLLKEPDWRRKQRIVLELRYHNVRMLLFRPFVTHLIRCSQPPPEALVSAANKCISSAQKTIEIIYETFKLNAYFRTWWYNTTYVTIAASVLLLYEFRRKDTTASSNIDLIESAVEILEVMEESSVARAAAGVIQHFLRELNDPPAEPAASLSNVGSMETLTEGTIPEPWSSLETEFPGLEFFDFAFPDMPVVFEELCKTPESG